MDIGIFQLLPRTGDRTAAAVIEESLWEIDFAERNGFESVWLAEHHLSGFGLVSAPSVFAAAIAARTTRMRIGYGVAVVPLHQPIRLAEEIAWLTHLSGGRVVVGVGPGFSEREFAGYGVPLEERHARFEEGLAIVRRALTAGEIEPSPLVVPPIYRAVSSAAAARHAAREGTPILLGLEPLAALAEILAAFRDEGGDVADAYVLRRICLAPTDDEARALMPEDSLDAGICGSPETAREQLDALAEPGVRRIIAWFNFAEMPWEAVRRSMELTAPLYESSFSITTTSIHRPSSTPCSL
jgi:alkanesulfonate monooxygenase SsuD/methylene tetrahydromethanopterin reductase-like flavin-dependent oxidoreductase (luciferase family)